jgi:hypothetical protein
MYRICTLLLVALLLTPFADAKDKNKPVLTADIVHAQTVRVVIYPGAGEPLADVSSNRTARQDVERALEKWGRFRIAMESEPADLLFAVRRGTGRVASPTIKGRPVDNRSLDDGGVGIGIGTQRGRSPGSQTGTGVPQDSGPRVSNETGPAEDMLEVYRGQQESPLENPPAWRYLARDGLHSPTVPAVDEFRKVFDQSEKALDQNQKKKP